jgi:hypothetical protein
VEWCRVDDVTTSEVVRDTILANGPAWVYRAERGRGTSVALVCVDDSVIALPAWSWAPMDDAVTAWEKCDDAEAMLRAVGDSVPRGTLVLAACAVVRCVLDLVLAGDDRPRLAVEAAERWARGEATIEEVRKAELAASESGATVWSTAAAASTDVASAEAAWASAAAAWAAASSAEAVRLSSAQASLEWAAVEAARAAPADRARHAAAVRAVITADVVVEFMVPRGVRWCR